MPNTVAMKDAIIMIPGLSSVRKALLKGTNMTNKASNTAAILRVFMALFFDVMFELHEQMYFHMGGRQMMSVRPNQ